MTVIGAEGQALARLGRVSPLLLARFRLAVLWGARVILTCRACGHDDERALAPLLAGQAHVCPGCRAASREH